MDTTTSERRDWNWDSDGVLDGMYVETREVTVKNGPSAGHTTLVFDFHVGPEDELVSVWGTTVLCSKLARELRARRKPDFEPGERFTITPTAWKESGNGKYRDFDVDLEHAAPRRSAAELLGADAAQPLPPLDDTEVDAIAADQAEQADDIPF
jgi:hypothetical protein